MSNLFWTAEKVEQVRLLAHDGLTGTQIGERLGHTRAAIIGVCARHNIQLMGSFVTRTGRHKGRTKNEGHNSVGHIVPAPEDLGERARTCQFPLWGNERPGDLGFGKMCGAKVMTGKPYCHKHCAVAYQAKGGAA